MKKTLFFIFALTPLALFASEHVQTDILPRTVNFFIFAAIIYYLIADKLKAFLSDRTKSIQSQLDEVQQALKDSDAKVEEAKAELENAKKVAQELVEAAQADIEGIKSKIEASTEQEIAHLAKSLEDKMELESKKSQREIVSEILEELFASDNIDISQENLSKVILKKVA